MELLLWWGSRGHLPARLGNGNGTQRTAAQVSITSDLTPRSKRMNDLLRRAFSLGGANRRAANIEEILRLADAVDIGEVPFDLDPLAGQRLQLFVIDPLDV